MFGYARLKPAAEWGALAVAFTAMGLFVRLSTNSVHVDTVDVMTFMLAVLNGGWWFVGILLTTIGAVCGIVAYIHLHYATFGYYLACCPVKAYRLSAQMMTLSLAVVIVAAALDLCASRFGLIELAGLWTAAYTAIVSTVEIAALVVVLHFGMMHVILCSDYDFAVFRAEAQAAGRPIPVF